MKKYAVLSVTDKSGIVDFATVLKKNGYEIISTGGTARHLKENGIVPIEVSDFTQFPEVFEGRVKTLNPKIFAGILFRRDVETDIKEAVQNGIEAIDIVCVNLYRFEDVVKKGNFIREELIENIDIGGPSLIRAAAKNHKFVSILTSPAQYSGFSTALEMGKIDLAMREKLAFEAFSLTAHYDTVISNVLNKEFGINSKDYLSASSKKVQELRYGENPHQKGEVYGDLFDYFDCFHGKELSYNNILDLIAGVELIEELEPNSAVIIKHNNPSGTSTAETVLEAYKRALICDPVSAFGGIVVVNNEVDEELALKLNEIFLEIVCAPSYNEKAISILQKKKDRRLIKQKRRVSGTSDSIRSIPGGFLRQDCDRIKYDFDNLQFVTNRKPTAEEIEDLKFAWIVCKNVKSNTIVFVKNKMVLGVGAGQVSRIDSAKIAAMKAAEFKLDLKNSVAASDAFFPFADGLLALIKAGATAVIQPGGSVRDQEVIEAANNNNISMTFTGIRHFKH
ncbi:MAG: bifunctional phosphoribosylaminoimidazolecarboxamide formyltransferase/IMP cyclohydrolase [Ignavibacteriaceae bacterium]